MTNRDREIPMDAASAASREELANALTHGAGLVASAAGAAILVTVAVFRGDVWAVFSSAVFGATLVLLYAASTLYHAARTPRVKARLQVFDHCAIYLLIAGTYTPFTLLGLRGGFGWTLLAVAWVFAAAGVVFKLFFTGRFPRLSTALYLGMGWMAIVAAKPMLERFPPSTLLWIVAGGLAYTGGTVFYHSRRIPYAHAIWHMFVIAGSVCHYFAVLAQVGGGAGGAPIAGG